MLLAALPDTLWAVHVADVLLNENVMADVPGSFTAILVGISILLEVFIGLIVTVDFLSTPLDAPAP